MSGRAEQPDRPGRLARPTWARACLLLGLAFLAIHLLGGWRAGAPVLAAQATPGEPQPAGELLDDPCLPAPGISLAEGETAPHLPPPPAPALPWPAAAPLLPPPIA